MFVNVLFFFQYLKLLKIPGLALSKKSGSIVNLNKALSSLQGTLNSSYVKLKATMKTVGNPILAMRSNIVKLLLYYMKNKELYSLFFKISNKMKKKADRSSNNCKKPIPNSKLIKEKQTLTTFIAMIAST